MTSILTEYIKNPNQPTSMGWASFFNYQFAVTIIKKNEGQGNFFAGTETLTCQCKECKLKVWISDPQKQTSQPAVQIRYHYAHLDG